MNVQLLKILVFKKNKYRNLYKEDKLKQFKFYLKIIINFVNFWIIAIDPDIISYVKNAGKYCLIKIQRIIFILKKL